MNYIKDCYHLSINLILDKELIKEELPNINIENLKILLQNRIQSGIEIPIEKIDIIIKD